MINDDEGREGVRVPAQPIQTASLEYLPLPLPVAHSVWLSQSLFLSFSLSLCVCVCVFVCACVILFFLFCMIGDILDDDGPQKKKRE